MKSSVSPVPSPSDGLHAPIPDLLAFHGDVGARGTNDPLTPAVEPKAQSHVGTPTVYLCVERLSGKVANWYIALTRAEDASPDATLPSHSISRDQDPAAPH